MKRLIPLLLAILLGGHIAAQEALPKVYDESIDGIEQLDQAIAQAQQEQKFVLVQVGGNWCKWCLMFADFAVKNEKVAQVIKDNYIYIHLNTSKGNKNEAALRRLENPGRFGYPAFVILDEKGQRLHTQNSAYLEQGQGYNEKLVVEFLQNWTRKAIETIR